MNDPSTPYEGIDRHILAPLCNHCGYDIVHGEAVWTASTPFDTDSTNKGESTCLCHTCHEALTNSR